MISYNLGRTQFNYRIAALVLDGTRILVHQEEGERFWTVPGGRCEILEDSKETLRREMLEELGVEAEIGPLVWVVENFFRREGRDWHEIAFYFRVGLPAGCPLYDHEGPFPGVEEGKNLTFVWIPIEKAGEITLFPEFLRTRLDSLPQQTEHLVWKDSEERRIG